MNSDILAIENNGPLIQSSNFWQGHLAARGYFYLSVNAGAFRLLCPNPQIIPQIAPGAHHVVISILNPNRWQPRQVCARFMVEDGSETPWSIQMSPSQVDRCPPPDSIGQSWIASVWILKDNQPFKALEFPAHYQRVPKLP